MAKFALLCNYLPMFFIHVDRMQHWMKAEWLLSAVSIGPSNRVRTTCQ